MKIWAAKLGRLCAVCAQTDGLVNLLVPGRADWNLWGLSTPAAEGCTASSCCSLLSPWTCDPSPGYSFTLSASLHAHKQPESCSVSGFLKGKLHLSCKMPSESLLFPLGFDLYNSCKCFSRSLGRSARRVTNACWVAQQQCPSCWLQVLQTQQQVSKHGSVAGKHTARVALSSVLLSTLTGD